MTVKRRGYFLLTYLLDVRHTDQTPAPGQRSEDFHRCVLALCEGLVLTPLPRHTHLRVALVHQHPVDALRVDAARVLVRRLTVAARDLRQVGGKDLHLTNWPVDLTDRRRRDLKPKAV